MATRHRTRPNSPPRGSNRHRASTHPSVRAWIIAILLVALFIGGIAYLNYYRNVSEISPIHKLLSHSNKPAATPEPDFEFYTALPSGKLTLIAENSTNTTNTTPAATIKTVSNQTPANSTASSSKKPTSDYFLQVAAFQHYGDADKLKAQLLLDDFNANVSDYKIKNVEWFRVVVGPFYTLPSMSQAEAKLSALHYQAIPLVLKKE